jgi:hypothetical protein
MQEQKMRERGYIMHPEQLEEGPNRKLESLSAQTSSLIKKHIHMHLPS